jgi:hypothetical protein
MSHARDHAADAIGLRRLVAGDVTTYSVSRCFIRRDGTDLWCELAVTQLPSDMADGSICFAANTRCVQALSRSGLDAGQRDGPVGDRRVDA